MLTPSTVYAERVFKAEKTGNESGQGLSSACVTQWLHAFAQFRVSGQDSVSSVLQQV